MGTELKPILVKSGMDWYDAEVVYMLAPEDLDWKEAAAEYRKWREEVYMPSHPHNGGEGGVDFIDFHAWLVKEKGCQMPEIDEVWPNE